MPYDPSVAELKKSLEWLRPWCDVAERCKGKQECCTDRLLVLTKCDLVTACPSKEHRQAISVVSRRYGLRTAYVSLTTPHAMRSPTARTRARQQRHKPMNRSRWQAPAA